MRQGALQDVVETMTRAFAAADLARPGRAALDRALARLEAVAPAAVEGGGEDLAVLRHWEAALAPLVARDDALGDLGRALERIGPELVWGRRQRLGPGASEGFSEAHANAMLIGPGGLEPREDVWLGLSLMAPGTRYPDHDHPPEEVYLVLSQGAFLQGEADWLERAPGETLYNTPGIRHAMRAGEGAFLALWCLPV